MSEKMSKAEKLKVKIAAMREELAAAEAAARETRKAKIVRAATRAGALAVDIDPADIEAAFHRLVGGGDGENSQGAGEPAPGKIDATGAWGEV